MSYQPPPGDPWPPQVPFPPIPQAAPPQKKKMRRSTLIILVLAAAIALCVISSGIINAVSPQLSRTISPTATDVPTATAQVLAAATPTPLATFPIPTTSVATPVSQAPPPVTHGAPLLGGPIADFIAKYGAPNDHSDSSSYHWLRDSSSNVDGLIVWQLTHPKQADSIAVQAVNGDMPDMTAAIALCTAYNPGDSHQVKRVSLVDASGTQAGIDVIYQSAALARVFAPGDFTDANGNNAQRGSFDIQYLFTGGTQNIDSCSIIPGTQQTHL